MKLQNGAVYSRNYRLFVLVYCGIDQWMMVGVERHREKGMSCPAVQHGKDDEFVFTEEELSVQFNSDGWTRLDGRLRIEKIDEMALVEYPNGTLEELI